VLINSDQQLVAWPDTKAAPEGWQRTGVAGTQAHCVAFIDADWRTREKPDPPTDDSGLVERLRAGDEAAFGALVDRYHASFVRLAVGYLRDRSIAEEVAQEAWLGILQGLHQFAGRASFKTWMFRILVNCAKHRAVWESRFVAFSEHWGEAEDRRIVQFRPSGFAAAEISGPAAGIPRRLGRRARAAPGVGGNASGARSNDRTPAIQTPSGSGAARRRGVVRERGV
jgi:hypothetical protein